MPKTEDAEFKEWSHSCLLKSAHSLHGAAIDGCWEDEYGKLWAGNGEYNSQVNFCPVCGFKAKTKIGRNEDE